MNFGNFLRNAIWPHASMQQEAPPMMPGYGPPMTGGSLPPEAMQFPGQQIGQGPQWQTGGVMPPQQVPRMGNFRMQMGDGFPDEYGAGYGDPGVYRR